MWFFEVWKNKLNKRLKSWVLDCFGNLCRYFLGFRSFLNIYFLISPRAKGGRNHVVSLGEAGKEWLNLFIFVCFQNKQRQSISSLYMNHRDVIVVESSMTPYRSIYNLFINAFIIRCFKHLQIFFFPLF